MKVSLAISNRHIHLTEEDVFYLFGKDAKLIKKNDISQPGQYASYSVVTIKTEKNKIDNVRVIGPCRNYTQVEISKTDSYLLGINPPYRNSGDLSNSETVTIVGPNGSLKKDNCCIMSTRHIHVEEDNDNFENNEVVKIKITGEKAGIMENVYIKKEPNSKYELHLDTDDANAFNLKNNDIVEILK